MANMNNHEHDFSDQGYGYPDRVRANTVAGNDRLRGGGYDQHFNRGFDRNYGGYDRNFDRNQVGADRDRYYGMNDRGFDRPVSGGYDRDRAFGTSSQWNDRNFGGGYDRDFDRFYPGQGTFGGNSFTGNYPAGGYNAGGYFPGGFNTSGYTSSGQFVGNTNVGRDTWNQPGPFTGVGPKNFQRSDESIREDVCHRLTQHGTVDAHDVDVSVHNSEVTLKGTVDSRQMKRLAEEATETVVGVRDVHNQLQVNKTQQVPGTPGMQQNQHSDNNVMQTANSNSH